ncbi:hypothetical protein JIN85_19585 [Luteolibacter pohnpeiensis]|uniref:Uncharacterized protein n=1 Tax=Luteolibacter pohnpeiensis TaxID=454153 RepID=A0A934SG88_9BACT|nr:hypothetical protein [Luteolibacter pohnpeiensis]MBK1884628.1 hypothetical protein [Luteolibacter pohnpeiensis]
MSDPNPSRNPLTSVGGIIGAVGGWLFSQYCGASMWIPGAACVLLLVLFAKTRFKPRYFMGAIAVTGGHIAWFSIGAYLGAGFMAVGLDILFLTVGVAWLWLRPGLAAAIFLGAIQALSLLMNAIALSDASFESAGHRALTAHVVFRVIAIACLIAGYLNTKKKKAEQCATDNSGSSPIRV